MPSPFLQPARLIRFCCLAMLVACAVPEQLSAQVISPRVVTADQPDLYSSLTLARYPGWAKAEPAERVHRLFQWLTAADGGLYDFPAAPHEGKDSSFSQVTDPLRLVNVYGFGDSRTQAVALAGLWEQSGFGSAVLVEFPKWKTAGQSQWGVELIAGDMRACVVPSAPAIFRQPEGTLASLEEVLQDDSVWQTPVSPEFFPGQNPAQVRKQILAAEPVLTSHQTTAGYAAEFSLRPGESLIRWWQPQGKRWQHPPEWKGNSEVADGPQRPESAGRLTGYSHGRFVYEPGLTEKSADLNYGLWNSHNVEAGPDGLTLTEKGKGFAIFEVRSPWIIVPLVEKPEDPKDDHGAALVEVEGKQLTVEVSLDQAVTWDPLDAKKLPAQLDLTSKVAGAYGYLLRIGMSGSPGTSLLSSLRITTFVQLAPATLPALKQGTNQLTFRTGDADGQPTRSVPLTPGCHSLAEFSRAVVFPPQEFQAKADKGRALGPFTVRLAAPPGCRINRLTAGGWFLTNESSEEATSDSKATDGQPSARAVPRIDYAAAIPTGFQPLAVFDSLPTGSAAGFAPLQLPEPAETVYLRYEGAPAVNSYQVLGHCQSVSPPATFPLVVRHAWRVDGGEEQTATRELTEPGEYSIDAGPRVPENISIEFSIPSQPAR